MSAHEYLQPHQFGHLEFGDFPGAGIEDVADRLYRNEPHFMAALEADVRKHGVKAPAALDDTTESPVVLSGHHRAAAAYRANRPLPVTRSGTGEDVNRQRDSHWLMKRRDHMDEYDARMAHDPDSWQDQ